MADGTKIEWADATVNAVNGCSLASPGCTNCYAMRLAGTRMKHHPSRAGLTQDSKAGPVWTGEVRLSETQLLQPLAWKRARRIFWNAHGDLFHENVPDEWIDRVFAVCALTPQHTHMILTKRSARMREYMSRPAVEVRIGLEALGLTIEAHAANRKSEVGSGIILKGTDINPGALKLWPLPNVWLGVSVEDQERRARIDDLGETPAAVRFVSFEPLIGRVDVCEPLGIWWNQTTGAWVREHAPKFDWAIVGGESGPGARPMHPAWARALRDQCAAAGVAFLFKQHGEWMPVEYFDGFDDDFDYRFGDGSDRILGQINRRAEIVKVGRQEYARVGKVRAGRLLDGREHNEFPEVRHA